MTRANLIISMCEIRNITVALHDPGIFEGFYSNADIFGFELWDVPTIDPLLNGKKIASNYTSLFSNLAVIHKKDIRKHNDSKQRIGIEIRRLKEVYLPDNIWGRVNIETPRKDQILFMQCLYILFKEYGVKLIGMEERHNVHLMLNEDLKKI